MNLLKISPIAFSLGEDLTIRWYAICILCGALITFFVSRWCFKNGGYKGDIADSIFVSAFPAGILGARIWWCISDSSSPWKRGNFWGVFTEFGQGGLAIQGGVILGALVGIWVVLYFYKECNIFYAMDAVIPNILIAQAMGRWGNFFNQEVYGACVDADKLKFLPNFIKNQMQGDLDGLNNIGEYSQYDSYINCQSDLYAQPLFLYESLLNIIGWVLITFILRRFWKKGRKDGDLAGLYFIWYGLVRAFLEPLRNSEFIMNGWGTLPVSVVTSIIFVVLGILFMICLRIIPKITKKVKEKKNA